VREPANLMQALGELALGCRLLFLIFLLAFSVIRQRIFCANGFRARDDMRLYFGLRTGAAPIVDGRKSMVCPVESTAR
jgi:hypothetical protein